MGSSTITTICCQHQHHHHKNNNNKDKEKNCCYHGGHQHRQIQALHRPSSPLDERRGITHHLLGEVNLVPELTPLEFQRLAGSVIFDIISRWKLPLIVSGSNSVIHVLVVEQFDPESNVFNELSQLSLRYNCCFLVLFSVGVRVFFFFLGWHALPWATKAC
jgi:hypothetical protein